MTRSIDSSTIAELAKDAFNLATLIQFDFPSPIRITDWDKDVFALGVTFPSSSHFLGVDNVKETSELRVNSMNITLSGVDQTYIALFLNSNYIDIPVNIYRAVMSDAAAVIGSPILIFNGVMTGYEIEDSQSESTIKIAIASHWKDFEKENGRKTNSNSQKLHFSSDNGFEFAAASIKDMKWGRK